MDLAALAGGEAQAKMLGERLPEIYQVLSHDAVSQVLRDGRTFSSAEAYAACLGIHCGLGEHCDDGDTYELTSALDRALAEDFAAGEGMFAGCTPAGGEAVNESRA